MTEWYNDIFGRWVRAFDEFASLSRYRDMVRTTKYASSSRYDLKSYTPHEFPAGGVLLDEMPRDEFFPRTYGFDGKGRPVHMSHAHEYNQVHWEGFYNYMDDRVEYVEYCIETGVPDALYVLYLENGRQTVWQQFQLNGGGSYVPEGTDIPAYIARVAQDERAVICNIEKYIYEGDGIVGADCISNSPGIGRFEYRQVYKYDDKGELDEIRNIYEEWPEQIVYARVKEDVNEDELVDTMAVRLADIIVKTLLDSDIETPVAILELSYLAVQNYMPFLVARSQAYKEEVLASFEGDEIFGYLFTGGYEHMITIKNLSLDRPLQQLDQIMAAKEDYKLGKRMLYKTARLLTEGRLAGEIGVSDDFIAYAADWSMDAGRSEEILRECGMPEERLEEWKGKGWL